MIITAHDGNRYYKEMAEVAQNYAVDLGYSHKIVYMDNVKHSKPKLLRDTLKQHGKAIWMDADSVMLRDVSELLNDEIVLAYKDNRSTRYGSKVYSGLVILQDTPEANRLLDEWEADIESRLSDQRTLNDIIDGFSVKLINPDVYVHQKSIQDMCAPPEYVKILHFKGALHKNWPEYSKKFLC